MRDIKYAHYRHARLDLASRINHHACQFWIAAFAGMTGFTYDVTRISVIPSGLNSKGKLDQALKHQHLDLVSGCDIALRIS
jgi:hypothetical protein